MWIVDLNARRVQVYRQPAGEIYTAIVDVPGDRECAPQAVADLTVAWRDVFPPDDEPA